MNICDLGKGEFIVISFVNLKILEKYERNKPNKKEGCENNEFRKSENVRYE